MNSEVDIDVLIECPVAPGFGLSKQNVVELTQIVTRNEKIARIKDWVQVQTSIPSEDFFDVLDGEFEDDSEEGTLKRKFSDCDSDEVVKKTVTKSKGRRPPGVKVYLDCEWIGCRYNAMEYPEFQKHVKSHIPQLVIKSYEDGRCVYVCLWDLCRFETDNNNEITRHIKYHTYHTRIKAVGKAFRDQYCIQHCVADSVQRNKLPALKFDFTCQWAGCGLSFNCIQNFFDHVKSHSLGTDIGNHMYACDWLGCKHRTAKAGSIQTHMRVHTNEKCVACANCGTMFATNTKYRDHCERQTTQGNDFKCPTCNKLFYNERLLRNHERYHNKSYKCNFCDLSLTTPGCLSRHIQCAHIGEKHFKCHLCPFASARDGELQRHLNRHNKTHVDWIGFKDGRMYACHECTRQYPRGHALTCHLTKKHGYSTPPGAVRFKYVLGEDGIYRLCESQVTKTSEVKPKEVTKLGDANYKVVQCATASVEKPASFVVLLPNQESTSMETILAMQGTSIKENVEINECVQVSKRRKVCPKSSKKKKAIKQEIIKETEELPPSVKGNDITDVKNISLFETDACSTNSLPQLKNIEISIADVDKHGNIVKTEVLESQELMLD